ncbi:hypothetical protein M438DRAFT_158838 [Aureobasidium pullulans EXF-150]|uniref:Uncharacterized protein n=1 Tax=Aureobasidium pullulans EXF-150 TaxID=1043002 RepID=A0A074XY73_AURPU|nr:uncharacterized protein M438DRAFT_158838 [Aureobasidium pullulans EXF-150]KEQ86912.1 hypothetical protein M438DRAFT_158838 [Aureobasidium pullulans EXF-150]
MIRNVDETIEQEIEESRLNWWVSCCAGSCELCIQTLERAKLGGSHQSGKEHAHIKTSTSISTRRVCNCFQSIFAPFTSPVFDSTISTNLPVSSLLLPRQRC